MSDGIRHRIERVEAKPGLRLLVAWRTGEQTIVDFSNDINRGGIWAALADERLFAQARAVRNGTALEWPEPRGQDGSPRIDIDADGLYAMAMQQRERPWIGRVLHTIFDRRKTA